MSQVKLVSALKSEEWGAWVDENGCFSAESVQRMILLDIRRELQTLNQLLSCSNFTGIPRTLKTIARQTAKPRRVPRAKKATTP